MKLGFEDLVVLASFIFFAVNSSWQSVCVILIAGLIKSLSIYFNRQQKAVDLEKIEEKIAKVAQDVKNVNLRLGFQRA